MKRFNRVGILLVALAIAAMYLTRRATEAKDQKWEAELEASMKAFDDRTQYPKLTNDVLKGIPDSALEQALIDFVTCKVRASGKPEREVVGALSPGLRAVYTTWTLEGEVNNGGFNQFFWNPSGVYAEDAAAGFDLLGAKAYAGLVRRAIAIRDAQRAKIKAFKDRGTVEAFSDSYKDNALNPLDDEFYELGAGLSQARIAFIRAKPEMFVGECR